MLLPHRLIAASWSPTEHQELSKNTCVKCVRGLALFMQLHNLINTKTLVLIHRCITEALHTTGFLLLCCCLWNYAIAEQLLICNAMNVNFNRAVRWRAGLACASLCSFKCSSQREVIRFSETPKQKCFSSHVMSWKKQVFWGNSCCLVRYWIIYQKKRTFLKQQAKT